MMINLKLEGFPEEIVNEMVEKKIASNKTDAIRLMILHYNEHFGIKPMKQYLEDEMAVKKMQRIDAEIAAGKRKVISEKEFYEQFPELRDV
ncbi:hypothetical protein KJ780_02215 [Candidatus Micrarchaeota archaeon]|nr:hypothetical protein [Candidatus Micrarchaeota archaeon]